MIGVCKRILQDKGGSGHHASPNQIDQPPKYDAKFICLHSAWRDVFCQMCDDPEQTLLIEGLFLALKISLKIIVDGARW